MPGQASRSGPQETKPPKPARVDGTVLRLSPDELVRLAPRLRDYLATPVSSWLDVVDAADWLPGELGSVEAATGRGLSRHGPRGGGNRGGDRVGEAGGQLPVLPGRVFPRDGGEAKAGELNLARTIWGLRARDRKAGEGRSPH